MHNVCREDLTGPRFARAGLALAAYEHLRLGKVDWRRLADLIAGPVLRRHRLRNVGVRIWLDAICGLDCGDKDSRGSDAAERSGSGGRR